MENKDNTGDMLTEKLLTIVNDLQGGNITEARDAVFPLLDKHHKDYRIWHLAGLIACQAGNHAQAEIYLLQTHQLAPRETEPLINLARVYALENKLNLAASCYLKALSIDAKHIPTLYGLVALLISANKFDKAIEYIDDWLTIDNNPKAYQLKIHCETALKEYNNAEETYKAWLAVKPDDVAILLQFGDFLTTIGKYKLALPKYKKCLKLDKENNKAKKALALAYYLNHDYDRAIKIYQNILEKSPEDDLILGNLSCVYKDLHDFKNAKLCIEKIISLNKASPEIFANLAIIYYQEGQYNRSKECYEKAINMSESPRAFIQVYASSLLRHGDYKHAWPWFTKGFSCINEIKLPLRSWQKIHKNDKPLLIADGQIKNIIQLSRVIPILLKKIKAVYCYHPNEAVRDWLATYFKEITVLSELTTLPKQINCYSSFMALPELLALEEGSIIRRAPYIHVENKEKEQGVFIALDATRLKNVSYKQYITQLLKKFEKVTIFTQEKIRNYIKGVDFYYSEDLVQLTEIIAQHKQVIANDTLVIHLAGALAKPSVVVLDDSTDWCWPINKPHSSWYPKTHIIQSATFGAEVRLLQDLRKTR